MKRYTYRGGVMIGLGIRLVFIGFLIFLGIILGKETPSQDTEAILQAITGLQEQVERCGQCNEVLPCNPK